MKHLYRAFSIIFAGVILLTFIFGAVNYTYFSGLAAENIETYGLIAVFVISFIVDFVPQYVSPHFAMISAMLLGLNFYAVCFLAVTGSFLGSVLSFELGRVVRTKIINEVAGKKNNDYIKHALNGRGVWFVALATVTPLPYLPIVLGSLHMSRKKFYLFGIVPRALGIIAFGLILLYIL